MYVCMYVCMSCWESSVSVVYYDYCTEVGACVVWMTFQLVALCASMLVSCSMMKVLIR